MGQVARFEQLRKELGELARNGALSALKTGTEVEDMSFEDIAVLRAMSRDILPLYVKIGGPEARNDMRELHLIGVDGIIAPMIESPYALKKFILTMREVLGPKAYEAMERGINLETIDGFTNMNAILASPEAAELHQITAARTDLSGSMNLEADHERVVEICSVIVARARENELRTSVGGGIHPGAVTKILSQVNPNWVNTRHMVMESKRLRAEPAEMVRRNLTFEAGLCEYMSAVSTLRREAYLERARVIRKRLNISVGRL